MSLFSEEDGYYEFYIHIWVRFIVGFLRKGVEYKEILIKRGKMKQEEKVLLAREISQTTTTTCWFGIITPSFLREAAEWVEIYCALG